MKYLSHDAVKPDKEKGLAVNTVGKTLKNLKIFLRRLKPLRFGAVRAMNWQKAQEG